MNEQRIQSNLRKLIAAFLVICLLIGGIAQYFLRCVSDLYTESVQGRLEERALQVESQCSRAFYDSNLGLNTIGYATPFSAS